MYHFPQSCNVLLLFKLKFLDLTSLRTTEISHILLRVISENRKCTYIGVQCWVLWSRHGHWPGWGWVGQGQRGGSALSYPTKCPPNPPAYSLDWRVPRFQLLFSQIISLIARVRGGWEWPLLSSVATPPTLPTYPPHPTYPQHT